MARRFEREIEAFTRLTARKGELAAAVEDARRALALSLKAAGREEAFNAMNSAILSTASRRMSRVQSDDGAGASPRVTSTVSASKRSDQTAISRDDVRAKPLPHDQRSAMGTDSPAALPSRGDDPSSQTRKRTIMARYVFRAELKPGERWKRRLLASR